MSGTFTKVTTSANFGARYGLASVYVPPLKSVVVIGGFNGTQSFEDFYTVNTQTNAVAQFFPTGHELISRYYHTANYMDGPYNAIAVIGGASFTGSSNIYLSDIVLYELATNSLVQIGTVGQRLSLRYQHTTTYIGKGKFVLIGGGTGTTPLSDNTWQLVLTPGYEAIWSRVIPTGPAVPNGVESPLQVMGHSAAYDSKNYNIYISYGILAASGPTPVIWTLNSKSYYLTKVTTTGLLISLHTSQFVGNQLYLFCGLKSSSISATYIFNPTTGVVSNITTTGNITPRDSLASTYDSSTNTVYLIGGRTSTPENLSDIWTLTGLPADSSSPTSSPSSQPSSSSNSNSNDDFSKGEEALIAVGSVIAFALLLLFGFLVWKASCGGAKDERLMRNSREPTANL